MEGWSPAQFDDFLSQRNLIQHRLLSVGLRIDDLHFAMYMMTEILLLDSEIICGEGWENPSHGQIKKTQTKPKQTQKKQAFLNQNISFAHISINQK